MIPYFFKQFLEFEIDKKKIEIMPSYMAIFGKRHRRD